MTLTLLLRVIHVLRAVVYGLAAGVAHHRAGEVGVLAIAAPPVEVAVDGPRLADGAHDGVGLV